MTLARLQPPRYNAVGGYLDDFNAAMGDANARWEELRSGVVSRIDNARNSPTGRAISLAVDFAEKLDVSSPRAFMDSLLALASMMGPIGGVAAAAVSYVDKATRWLVSQFPAFTYQLQNEHLAYLNLWIAANALGVSVEDRQKVIPAARAAGWSSCWWTISRDWCEKSAGPTLMGPWVEGRQPEFLDDFKDAWNYFAGPRETAVPWCVPFYDPTAVDWKMSPEGMKSAEVAERLLDTLSKDGFKSKWLTELDGYAPQAWQAEGVQFFRRVYLDIDPGYPRYHVPLAGFCLNATFLPDDLLGPLGTFFSLLYTAKSFTGGGPVDNERFGEIERAAFGPDLEMYRQYNILRMLAKESDPALGIGVMGEVGRRWGAGTSPLIPSVLTDEETSAPSSPLAIKRAAPIAPAMVRASLPVARPEAPPSVPEPEPEHVPATEPAAQREPPARSIDVPRAQPSAPLQRSDMPPWRFVTTATNFDPFDRPNRNVLGSLGSLVGSIRVPADPEFLEAALEGLVRAAMVDLRAHPEIPSLYSSGVVWKAEEGTEDWDIPSIVYARGWGDCEDLTAWRTAERRLKGERGARARVVPGVLGYYHAIVEGADGRREDPSRKLGMEVPAMGGRTYTLKDVALKWKVEPNPNGGWKGEVAIPLVSLTVSGALRAVPTWIVIQGCGDSKVNAIGAALRVARTMDAHPGLRKLLGPKNLWRIKALSAVANTAAERQGKIILGRIRERIVNPGVRRFAELMD